MRRVWAGFGQAVESAAIAAVGLLVCALVLLAVWGIDQGFGGDPLAQWRIAADAWLVGHGVDLTVALGADAVIAVGIEAASRPFAITLAAWGVGLITLWLHWRGGRRLAELPALDAAIAALCGAVAVGTVGLVVAVSAQHPVVSPGVVQAFLLPAAVALIGMAAAIVRAHGHGWLEAAARGLTIEDRWLRAIRAALRAGAAGAVAVLGVGALVLAVGIFARFSEGLLVMESLQVTHVGAGVLLLVQLALAPVAVVWAASWALGPGFMIGTGSQVSPLGTDLGPVPALPLLSAIDPEAAPWMLAVVALPVLAAVVVGALARQTILAGSPERPVHWWELAIAGVGGGVLAGALLGIAAMLASGAIGPGRLDEAGPDAVQVAAWGALEVGAGLLIGLVAGARGPALGAAAPLPLAREGHGSTLREVLGLRTAEAERGAADLDEPGRREPEPPHAAPAGPDGTERGPEDADRDAPTVADRTETQVVEPLDDHAPTGRATAAEPGHPHTADEAEQPPR
ncbi:DUF6350 family protein [Agrococcus sp. HG114]|uniref:cell division protein PerM n=1 Tax=Agrococcus sp. HG114 TaxID=2969757 RepID=UPI00215ACE33|nr:DUF6350 family protein [Agrococcus sp. HG114]MCR8670273.1 DUF6350 family protein [Agrococcus sp. HG114]